MKYLSFLLILVAIASFCFTAEADMQSRISRATTIINEFKDMPEEGIPNDVLRNCKGLAIITMGKGGFILSVRAGNGLVIARDPKTGWTGPSAISTGGAGIGLQIGGQVTDFVLVLNTDDAVKAFSKGGNCSLGADASIAAGPLGRTAEAGITPQAAIYSYSRSKGLFAGVSLEGSVLGEDSKVNAAYYGEPSSADKILAGLIQPGVPPQALYDALTPYGGVVKAEPVKAPASEHPAKAPAAEHPTH